MSEWNAEWQAWLSDNRTRGCSVESMIAAMVGAGFPLEVARRQVEGAAASPAVEAAYRYDRMPVAAGNRIDVGDRMVTVALRCERPQVLVLDGVLSSAECEEIMARSRDKLRRSTTVDPLTGKEDVIDRRTSEGTFFARCEDDFIRSIDERVARLMNWPLENGEGLQILRYGVGGEYTPHFDYFPPADPGSAAHVAQGGQRVATLIIYLNDVAEGGATIFPDAGLTVTPRQGSAVYFRYGNQAGQLDAMTLHGGAPVEGGEKWIMTKWMRERRYG
ncbi:2-oxoglutarate-dependent dioxygenase [Chitinimonas arctica]|uniref:2-oxoglutarate-dependent dioxygenase n=1 Tax=Chitinimonas arctica TaxID=2594795 RepID=A0A516SHD7_9NEIS|nr:2OG-Fe(II) oxygenase [Chitinimonas arctica]QDQ27542.1 2-oxoglutarate-dependent dioxygenase [Chitinimonas arctica]